MDMIFSEAAYEEMLGKLFVRFPSFQKTGAGAYKPGITNMEFADQMMGHPHRNYDIIHVAGTNGKGSVSNMLASVLASCGQRVGLYTSPHILDFRERMRVVEIATGDALAMTCEGDAIAMTTYRLVSKEYVWKFMEQWRETFDHLDLSFFEITTIMALQWFADENVDVVVLETGLGGRLDSTNIVNPVLSIITNIGLDHCDLLGDTLPEIAFEKAGIIKPKVPVVVGESDPEIDPVFERKVLYTNLPEPQFMGNRPAIMSLLTFADKTEPPMWEHREELLAAMDLQGSYQRRNLRTVLSAIQVLQETAAVASLSSRDICDAIIHAARNTGFRGRWEILSESPLTIADIGHNAHGLRHNFGQLARMKESGEVSDIIMVYGSVADKDVDAVLILMPKDVAVVFTQAQGKRALPAEEARDRYLALHKEASDVYCEPDVTRAVSLAMELASNKKAPAIYVGGSTYVVSEAMAFLNGSDK